MCRWGVLTQVPLTAEALSITGSNLMQSGLSPQQSHRIFFFAFFVLLYQKELGFGLAAAFLTCLNNPTGQPDKTVKAVVMFLLLLT